MASKSQDEKKKRPVFLVNKEAYGETVKKGSTYKERPFINVRDLPVGTHYYRVFPPMPDHVKALGKGVPVAPQLMWFLAKGGNDGYLTSISEKSMGEDEDSVVEWLKAQGLHEEKGFREDGNRVSDRVLAWRQAVRPAYDKDKTEAIPLQPSRGNEYVITVLPVERDLQGDRRFEKSIAKDTAKFLVLTSALNKQFAVILDSLPQGEGGVFDMEYGQDLALSVTLSNKGKKEYTLTARGITTELEDFEAHLDEQPSLIAEFRRGCKPQEIIKYLAQKLQYTLPKVARDDEGDEEEEEEEDEKPAKNSRKKVRLDLGKGAKPAKAEEEEEEHEED